MVKVSVEEPPAVTEAGLNEPLTPAGAPLSESATLWADPVVTAVVTDVDAPVEPCAPLTEAGDAAIEKSSVDWPTTPCDVSQPLASLAYVPCMANEPLANAMSVAPPVPTDAAVPTHAHLSAFS